MMVMLVVCGYYFIFTYLFKYDLIVYTSSTYYLDFVQTQVIKRVLGKTKCVPLP